MVQMGHCTNRMMYIEDTNRKYKYIVDVCNKTPAASGGVQACKVQRTQPTSSSEVLLKDASLKSAFHLQ